MSKTAHDKLVEKAIEAINEVFGDTSVDKQATLDSLDAIASVIESNIIAVSDDLENEE